MCIQDIQIARKAGAGRQRIVDAVDFDTVIMSANPNRFSITVSLYMGNAITGSCGAVVGYKADGANVPLVGVSTDHPVATVNLLDIGAIIFNRLYVWSSGETAPEYVTIVETQFNEDIERTFA